jgi:DNA repair protein RecO (recombination protein O)
MDWRDVGFVLSARRHGESAMVVELLTAEHGRHAGLVRGGQSPHRRALLQPGNEVATSWRGRLPEHLGTLECELVAAHAAGFLDDPNRLAALSAAVALLLAALPEREPHPDLHASFAGLLTALSLPTAHAPTTPTLPLPRRHEREEAGQSGLPEDAAATWAWAEAYVLWECHLLAALGFGLDLGRCAVTGTNQDLAYVSPRTGRAVSRDTGTPYRDRLLPLPGFLWHDAPATLDDIVAGLILTRHFLLHHLLEPQGGALPEARERFAERMRRAATNGMVARQP